MVRVFLGILGITLLGANTTFGQTTSTPSPAIGISPMANPYLNPYANPYVNPHANPYILPMTPGAGMGGLYAFSAATSLTGIGSGQLSGSRGVVAAGSQKTSPRDIRPDTTHDSPGAGASRYFQGAYGPTTGADRYYGRHNRHFFSNRP